MVTATCSCRSGLGAQAGLAGFFVASLQNRYAASIMVSATCSCRSGLASLFLVAARQTAAVLLLWQLRPGTRIARLGAQAGLAVFLSLRSKTAMQHRSWFLRRAPVAAGSLLYFLSLR